MCAQLVSYMRVKKGDRGTAREWIWCYMKSTGNTMFSVSDIVVWLKKQGIEITDGAIRAALWRLAKKGLAKKIGEKLWTVDVNGLGSLINNKRNVCIASSSGSGTVARKRIVKGDTQRLLKIIEDLLSTRQGTVIIVFPGSMEE